MAKNENFKKFMKSIPGYSLYYATIEGNILKRKGDSFYLLKPSEVHNGYYTVNIRGDNFPRKHRTKVHRLIALAWVPNLNPKEYTIVCHKDNNPKNNRPENLYWGNQSMNMQQMVHDGRQRKSKLIKFFDTIQSLNKQGFSLSEIRDITGVSKTSIRRFIENKNNRYGKA